MPKARYSDGSTTTPVVPIWRWWLDPAAIGDDAGRAHRRPERASDAASWRNRSARSSPAPPPTMRSASARSIVATSGGSTSTTATSAAVLRLRDVIRHGRRRTASVGALGVDGHPAHARLQGHDDRAVDGDVVQLSPAPRARRTRSGVTWMAPASRVGPGRGRGGGRGRVRRERPAAPRRRRHHRRGQRSRPAGRGEVAELEQAHLAPDPDQLVSRRGRTDDSARPAALGDGLGTARRAAPRRGPG